MNIFAVSPNPLECASALDDKRLVKMVLETAQILCTTAHLRGFTDLPYKPTHIHHPVVVWCESDNRHWRWTSNLFVFLAASYSQRFRREHLCWITLMGTKALYRFQEPPPTTWANCTPYKTMSVHEAYKRYLRDKWKKDDPPPRWTSHASPNFRLKS